MLPRCASLAGLLTLEIIAASLLLDTAVLSGRHGLAAAIGDGGPALTRWLVTYALALAAFLFAGSTRVPENIAAQLRRAGVSLWALLAHATAAGVFFALSRMLFRPGAQSGDTAVAVLWCGAAMSLAATALAIFVPMGLWPTLARAVGSTWAYAGGAATLVIGLAQFGGKLWAPTTKLTFACVRLLLHPVLPSLTADAKAMVIGSNSFAVTINPECSGLEGAALMLAFGAGWLALFRREYRFPQALVLLPAGVSAVWMLNCFRIAALILIGDAGAGAVAMGGFHSQAGWIAFNSMAVAFAVGGRRIAWVSRTAAPLVRERNPLVPYLVPFLAILAAAMASKAASSGSFESFYGLRLLVAAAALWCFRGEYAALDWRSGWRAPAIGAVVFLVWMAAERFAGGAPSALGAALAPLSPTARTIWLGVRVFAAVVTVPIAEELAFRAFLLRRLIGRDFEAVDPRRYTLPALAVSAIVFGVLHGSRWAPGVIAGILYGLAYARRGRIGEAVVAHATTNALLAVWVLWRGEWGLW